MITSVVSIPPDPHFGRVMIFIDGPNFYKRALEYFGIAAGTINFQIFASTLIAGGRNTRSLVRAHYYDAHVSGAGSERIGKNLSPDERRSLLTVIRTTPDHELHLPEMDAEQRPIKQEVDVRLAVDMVRFAALRTYDVAVLVSSDSDFIPAIRAVKDLGCKVELVYFPQATDQNLLDACDRRRLIDEALINRILSK